MYVAYKDTRFKFSTVLKREDGQKNYARIEDYLRKRVKSCVGISVYLEYIWR